MLPSERRTEDEELVYETLDVPAGQPFIHVLFDADDVEIHYRADPDGDRYPVEPVTAGVMGLDWGAGVINWTPVVPASHDQRAAVPMCSSSERRAETSRIEAP